MIRIAGHPIVFGVDSVDLGGFIEVIRPAAFQRTLDEGLDVVALRNHDSNFPLGRTSSKTLTLATDKRGVVATLDADDDVSFVQDLAHMIRRGDATGGSFAFTVADGGDLWSLRHGVPFREILDMRVREVSFGVAFPAYESTRLAVESTGASRAVSLELAQKRHLLFKAMHGIPLTNMERARMRQARATR